MSLLDSLGGKSDPEESPISEKSAISKPAATATPKTPADEDEEPTKKPPKPKETVEDEDVPSKTKAKPSVTEKDDPPTKTKAGAAEGTSTEIGAREGAGACVGEGKNEAKCKEAVSCLYGLDVLYGTKPRVYDPVSHLPSGRRLCGYCHADVDDMGHRQG